MRAWCTELSKVGLSNFPSSSKVQRGSRCLLQSPPWKNCAVFPRSTSTARTSCTFWSSPLESHGAPVPQEGCVSASVAIVMCSLCLGDAPDPRHRVITALLVMIRAHDPVLGFLWAKIVPPTCA